MANNPEKRRAIAARYRKSDAYRRFVAKYRKSRRVFIDAAKDRPCTDCGRQYPPWVMQFDHIRGIKRWNVSAMRLQAIPLIKTEIAKCDLVCANCHAARTHNRLHNEF